MCDRPWATGPPSIQKVHAVPARHLVGEHRYIFAAVALRLGHGEVVLHRIAHRIGDAGRLGHVGAIAHVLVGIGQGEAVRVLVPLDDVFEEGELEDPQDEIVSSWDLYQKRS